MGQPMPGLASETNPVSAGGPELDLGSPIVWRQEARSIWTSISSDGLATPRATFRNRKVGIVSGGARNGPVVRPARVESQRMDMGAFIRGRRASCDCFLRQSSFVRGHGLAESPAHGWRSQFYSRYPGQSWKNIAPHLSCRHARVWAAALVALPASHIPINARRHSQK